MTQKIEISHRTIVFTVLFLIGLWVLYQIRQVILALFISLTLMTAINPLVNKLEKWKTPRFLAILTIYVLIFGGFGLAMGLMISPAVEETAVLITKLPVYLKNFGFLGTIDSAILNQLTQFGSLPANLVKFTMGIFSNILGVFAILVITFYLLLERANLDKYLVILFGEGEEKRAKSLIDKIEFKLGGWVRGEVILMTVVGGLYYLGLRFLGIEFALPLAIIGGILEIVPNIGPTISAAPAILAGLTISSLHGLAAGGLYFLVQQLENTVIVPKVMQKAVGIYPLVTILSLTIGWKLAGAIGAILAVPIVLVIQEISAEFLAPKDLKA
jgi:predicted PurR-regulated permease PerM